MQPLLIISLMVIVELARGQVAYPEQSDVDKQKVNLAGRIPLYSPTRCGRFELLYPGDQKTDWICDCAPASLFYPDTEACYPAFRRGPCKRGEILVLYANQVIPQCVQNPCNVDGKIPINNKCYELGGSAPCKNPELSYVLGVNPKTLQVDCIKLSVSVSMRFGDDDLDAPTYDMATVEPCANGTKRAIQGRCPKTIVPAN